MGVLGLGLVAMGLSLLFLIVFARRLAERNLLITQVDLATARIVDRFNQLHHIIALDERGNMVRFDDRGRLSNRDTLGNTVVRLPNGLVGSSDAFGNQAMHEADGRWRARDFSGNEVWFYPNGELRIVNLRGEQLTLAPGSVMTIRNALGQPINVGVSDFEVTTAPDQTQTLGVRNGLTVIMRPNEDVQVLDIERRTVPVYAHRNVLLDEVYAPASGLRTAVLRHRHLFGGFYWIGIPFIDRVRWLLTEEYEPTKGEMVPIRVDSLSLRDQYVEFDQQILQTADGAQAIIKGNIHFRIVDPYKAVVSVDNFVGALRDRYNGMVRAIVGGLKVKDLNKLKTSGLSTGDPQIDKEVQELQKVALQRWGILVLAIGFEDVTPESSEVVQALAKEAISAAEAQAAMNLANAQREARRAQGEGDRDYRVMQGEGDKKYRIAQGEADQVYRQAQAEADKKYFGEVFEAAGSVDQGLAMYQIHKIAEASQGPAATIVLNTDILRAVEGLQGSSSRVLRDSLASGVFDREAMRLMRVALERAGVERSRIAQVMKDIRSGRTGGGSSQAGGAP